VWYYTPQALLLYREGKKASPAPLPKRKHTYEANANAQHHQTKSLADGALLLKSSGVFFERERQRERRARTRSRPAVVLIEEKNSTFFSRKKVTKKDAERHRVSSLFSTLRKVYHHVLNTYTRTYKRTHKHEHRTTVFVFVEELRFHRRHGKRGALAQEE